MKWRVPWCWLGRFGLLAILVMLGVVLWQLVPPQPRCHVPTSTGIKFWHLSDDGRKFFLAFTAPDPHVEIWDTFSGKLEQTLGLTVRAWEKQKTFDPLRDGGYPVDYYHLLSTDKRYLLFWDGNRHAIFDLQENRKVPLAENFADHFFLSYAGQKYFCLSDEQETLVMEWATGRILKKYPLGRERSFLSGQLAPLSANEEYSLGDDSCRGMVTVDHLPSGQRALELPREEGYYFFSPASRYLLFYGSEQPTFLRAWDLPTGRQTVDRSGVRGPMLDDSEKILIPYFGGVLAITADDRFGICWKEDSNQVELFELVTGKTLSSLSLIEGPIGFHNHLRFSPHGRYLAAALEEENKAPAHLLLFEIPSGRKLWHQPPLRSALSNMVFRDDAQELLVSWREGITIHDTASGQQRLELSGNVATLGLRKTKGIVLIHDQSENDSWLRKMCEKIGLHMNRWSLEIVDPWTGRRQGQMAGFGVLALDGRTLMAAVERQDGTFFYDVPLRTPLQWVLGPPLVLGLLLLVLGYRLGRKKVA